MIDQLLTLAQIPAVGLALGVIVRALSTALKARAASQARLIDARTAALVAETSARETQTRITESDAAIIRATIQSQQEQLGALTERIVVLEEDVRSARGQRDEAHEALDVAHATIASMRTEYAQIQRTGRLPTTTPLPFKAATRSPA